MQAPEPRFISASQWVRQARNRDLGWTRAISEWLDNSIGNGATKVSVTWRSRQVEVRDNGRGCTPEMFAALVSPGWHQEDSEHDNAISMFGIGAKDAFVWCGGPTHCFSRRDNLALCRVVDWDDWGETPTWQPLYDGENADRMCRANGLDDSGVVVRQPQHTRQINKRAFEDIHRSLSRLFWAAVETGVEIDVRFYPPGKTKPIGGLLKGRPLPQFIEGKTIDEMVELADGRLLHVCGGILHQSVRMSSPGFEYILGHRVVVPACGLGAGGILFERVYFRVVLLGDKHDWRVTTNKCGLHDADEAAIGQAVYDRCKSLLHDAASQPLSSVIDPDLLKELADLVNDADRKRARRPGRGEKQGTVPPAGTDRRHEAAQHVHEQTPGNCTPKGQGRGSRPISIIAAEFEDDRADLVGDASIKDRIIRINTRHEFVSAITRQEIQREALFVLTMSVWSDAWTLNDEKGQMRMIARGEFISKLSRMLGKRATETNATVACAK